MVVTVVVKVVVVLRAALLTPENGLEMPGFNLYSVSGNILEVILCQIRLHVFIYLILIVTPPTPPPPPPPPFPDFYQGTISLVIGPRSNIRLPKSSKVFFYFSLIILKIIFRNIIILV